MKKILNFFYLMPQPWLPQVYPFLSTKVYQKDNFQTDGWVRNLIKTSLSLMKWAVSQTIYSNSSLQKCQRRIAKISFKKRIADSYLQKYLYSSTDDEDKKNVYTELKCPQSNVRYITLNVLKLEKVQQILYLCHTNYLF